MDQFVVTDLPASPIGKSIRFRIRVYNAGGHFTTSRSTTITIASTPSTPLTAPVRDNSVSSGSIIKIIYTEPFNGGSPITNYEIQMDDGLGGGFRTVAGGDSDNYLFTFF